MENGEAEESRDSDTQAVPLQRVKRTSHHWSQRLKVGSGSILKCVLRGVPPPPRTTDSRSVRLQTDGLWDEDGAGRNRDLQEGVHYGVYTTVVKLRLLL